MVIAALLLSSLAWSHNSLHARPLTLASPADEAAVRALVLRFFSTYALRDLDGFMSLWSVKSPDFASRRKLMQELFSAHDRFQVKSLTINQTTILAEKANARVSVELNAYELKTDRPAAGLGPMTRVLSFVREDSQWKVWREYAAAEDLAVSLLAAQTPAARAALLATEKDLVTAELWEALAQRGNNLGIASNYAEATRCFELAQEVAKQLSDQRGLARALLGFGTVNRMQGNYAPATEFAQKSLSLSETLDHKRGIADALNELGIISWLQSRYPQALGFHQRSLALREALADRPGIASSLSNLGVIYRLQGDFNAAVAHYQKSLALSEVLGDQLQMARTLNNLGSVHANLGNYDLALAYYAQSVPLSEAQGNKVGTANTLSNIGLTHRLLGNYSRALEYLLKALKLSEALGDRRGMAITLRALGQTFSSQGNRAQALEYFQKALRLNEAEGDKSERAILLGSIGNLYQNQGESAPALDYYGQSLTLREAIGDKSGVASVLLNLGGVYEQQGRLDLALEYFKKSLALRETLSGKLGVAEALQRIANFYQGQGAYTEALAAATRAAQIATDIRHRETLWRVRTTAGKAYRALNQPTEARQAFVEAIDIIESLRAQVGGDEREQQRFFENKTSPYYGMVDLLLAQQRAEEALAYVEGAKARVLLDVLQSGRINVTKAMSQSEQEKERSLKGELVSLNLQITRATTPAKPDAARLDQLNTSLRQARLNYEAFQTNLYAAHPELKVKRGEAQPITLAQTAELLPDSKRALLNYLVGRDKTYLLVFTRSERQAQVELRVYEIKIEQKELAARAESFRNLLAQRHPDFSALASQLYDLLLRPAQTQLSGKTNLVIVPDGPLWNLPFQALRSAPARYVIEDQAIAYAPSLTVLREMLKLRERRPKHTRAPTLLAFANPALGPQTLERAGQVLRDENLAPLPEAEKEVKALAQLYGAAQSKVYLGAEAREDRAKAEAGQYNILHLATHGTLNDTSPMYSHLLLSQTAGNDAEDGQLEAWELMNLNLRADLVVLSACDTARGRVGAGEGMIGLSWALFVAGTPTTVVSQWKVASASTAQLMVEFHRNLKPGSHLSAKPSEAAALRQAIIKLQQDERYRHPFYWASFVVVGDGF